MRAETRARADFATWKMLAKLNGTSSLSAEAQNFLANYKNLLEQMGFEILEFKHTAGVDLPEYLRWRPWKWLPRHIRRSIICALASAMPLLFGCQHVLKARRKTLAFGSS